MRVIAAVLVLGIVLSAFVAAGCMAATGNTSCVVPTLGKELMDLKGAKECGAVSAEEYQLLKNKLMATADRRCGCRTR